MLSKSVIHFFNIMKFRLGYPDWSIREDLVPTEGMCHHSTKRIAIGSQVKDYKYLVLHEFAHVGTCRFCNTPHNKAFWKEFEYLLWKYLKRELTSEDVRWKKLCVSGFQGYYRKCYDRFSQLSP